jgi:hypothetical protein
MNNSIEPVHDSVHLIVTHLYADVYMSQYRIHFLPRVDGKRRQQTELGVHGNPFDGAT